MQTNDSDYRIRIAVCDDSSICRELLTDSISELSAKLGREVFLEAFESPEELAAAVSDGRCYDAYFLDILMPEKDGITLAHEIRAIDDNCMIVFNTTSDQYALEAFAVDAAQYLIKPIKREALMKVLKKLLPGPLADSVHIFHVKTSAGTVLLNMENVDYAIRDDRAVRYHTSDGRVIVSNKLRSSFTDAVRDMLDRPEFMLVGASLVVNLDNIIAEERPHLIMKGGERLCPPETLFNSVKKQWLTQAGLANA